jgi:hypothetical protein
MRQRFGAKPVKSCSRSATLTSGKGENPMRHKLREFISKRTGRIIFGLSLCAAIVLGDREHDAISAGQ